MSTPSLDDLLNIPDQDAALNTDVLPELKKRSVRVTDWLTGGVYLAMAYVVALIRVAVRVAISAFVAAGFEDYVFGFVAAPNGIDVTGWCDFVGQQRYGLKRIQASYTIRNITLTNSTAATYGPIQPGDFMISFPSGKRYVNNAVFTIPAVGAGGVVTVSFRSELTTDSAHGIVYNDASGSTISLVTSRYSGVTATNPAPTYSPVTQQGNGVGIPVPGGAPSGQHSVAIRIDTNGSVAGINVGWSTNVDNTTWVPQTSSGVASNLGGVTGLNVVLADNGGGTNAFVKGALYFYKTPGSDITQVGADIETSQAYGTRCRGQVATAAFAQDANGNWIATSPTADAYSTLAKGANSQVRVVLAAPDPFVNNKVNLIIAGQGGTPLDASIVVNVSNFFAAMSLLTDFVNVQTSTARAFTFSGLTIYTVPGQTASAQSAMTLRLQQYIGGLDPSVALGINGTVDYDYLISLIRTTAGVKRVGGTLTVTANASNFTSDVSMPLIASAFESASWAQSATTAFSWATSS